MTAPSRTVEQVPVTTLADGHRLALTVHTLRGAHDGPHLALVGGIHGDEPLGPETVRRILATVDPAELTGTITAVPVANPLALAALSRNTPLDGLNLNRVFPGNRTGSVTEQIAAVLCEILADSTHLIDFHSGGNFATVDYSYLHEAGADMSRAYGCSLLYEHDSYVGSATDWALRRGANAMVSELGGGGQRIDHYLDKGVSGATNVLRTLGMLPGTPAAPPVDQAIVTTLKVIQPRVGGVLLSEFGADQIGKSLAAGTVLGRILSPYTFEELEVITAPYEPSILVLTRESMTNVAPGDYGFMVADGATARPSARESGLSAH